MGRVVVPAKVESLHDLYLAETGHLTAEDVRTVEVADALVDTGSTLLSLPKRYIAALGLTRYRTRQARTPVGIFEFGIYGAVRLTVQGRDCTVDVTEVTDDSPILIGQIPLEILDFVVDPKGQRLIGDPVHGGEDMIDML